jgi:hypothetical protein
MDLVYSFETSVNFTEFQGDITRKTFMLSSHVLMCWNKLKWRVAFLTIKFDGISSSRSPPGNHTTNKQKKTPGLQSAGELYRPSDRRLSAKLVPTLADRGCRVVRATNLHGR